MNFNIIFTFMTGFVFVAAAIPKVSITKFHSQIYKVEYLTKDNVLVDENQRIWISFNQGKTFERISEVPEMPHLLLVHPYFRNKAFIFSAQLDHYMTSDHGKTWSKFSLEFPLVSLSHSAISLHSTDENKAILHLKVCKSNECRTDVFYTIDGFATNVEELWSWVGQCEWAQSIDPLLENVKDRIYCTQWPFSEKHGDAEFKDPALLQLISSDQYFKNGQEIIPLGGGVPVLGITKNWLVAIVKSKIGYSLVSSKNGRSFLKGDFKDFEVEKSHFTAFSILESSHSSLFVDTVSIKPGTLMPLPFGTLYASNSDGNFFSKILEHTNRDLTTGLVDFEHIQSVIYEGIQLVNIVQNWQNIMNNVQVVKELETRMSYDNGKSWKKVPAPEKDIDGNPMTCKKTGAQGDSQQCWLHLHSITTTKNVGNIFSVSSAPGTIIGVGSVGEFLNDYVQSDTFISHDSGRSWAQIRRGPHKFENLGFGSVIVLVPDSLEYTSQIIYSTNGGKSWQDQEILIEGSKWLSLFTTVEGNSTSLNMLLLAYTSTGDKAAIHIDFQDIFSRACKKDLSSSNRDLELFSLTAPDGICVLGRSSSYWRRKADDCFMDLDFSQIGPTISACPCKNNDFECDIGFKPKLGEGLECESDGSVPDEPFGCRLGDTYLGLSGYRRIPGDQCSGGDEAKTKPVSKECKLLGSKPPDYPSSHLTLFSDEILEVFLIPSSTVSLILSKIGKVWVSNNDGESWNVVAMPNDEDVVKILTHETKKDRIFLLAGDGTVYISDDAMLTGTAGLRLMNTPEKFNGLGVPVLDFHPTETDWYTFVGGARDCNTSKCHTSVYVSKDGGMTFSPALDTWVTNCVWARDVDFEVDTLPVDSVFCDSFKIKDGSNGGQNAPQDPKNNPKQLVLLAPGKSKEILLESNVVNFFVVRSVLLATVLEDGPVVYYSTDGKKFAPSQFPPSITFEKQALTVLKSNTGGIFLDILQDSTKGQERGFLFKSGVNGDSFSRVLSNTNRGSNGKVDFVKLPGIYGVVVANVLMTGSKLVESKISFNDGSTWSFLKGPLLDSINATTCDREICKLHFHLQSSQKAYQGMISPFGTRNSPGLMLAVGNVGESLSEYEASNVFLTRDAGLSWSEVRKGPHKWAIGDSGGLLVLVTDAQPTNVVTFSWNYGVSWADYIFSDGFMEIKSILAHQDSQKIFMTGSGGNIIQLDFGSLFKEKCKLSDFETWTAGNSECFFGTKILFSRRKIESVCSVGPDFKATLPSDQSCECGDSDFECASNFFRNEIGNCVLLSADPDEPKDCENGKTYIGSSGYRKISLSRCTGGKDLTLQVERNCGFSPLTGINAAAFEFPNRVDDFIYFKNTSRLLAKSQNLTYFSSNNGALWNLTNLGSVFALLEDPYRDNRAFVIEKDKFWVTSDQGDFYLEVQTIDEPNLTIAPDHIIPHPTLNEALIRIGSANCDGSSDNCHTIASVTWDLGKTWNVIDYYASSCKWAADSHHRFLSEKIIYCSVFDARTGDQTHAIGASLYRYDSGDSKSVKLMPASGFTIEGDYIVVATPNQNSKVLQLMISVDGLEFSKASFPDNLKVSQGYTVLESLTGNLFLHVIQSNQLGMEYGTVVKSNWNGTNFHISLEKVNQNDMGYVDFEKIQGLNGTFIANQISNLDIAPKKLESKISFDDGETWNFLKPPGYDSNNKTYPCLNSAKCNLHLHAFTERHDKRDGFSTFGAVGLLIGVGNVGETLSEFSLGDMFLSRDAGLTWTEIAKEAHMVEVSDHGGIILMINDEGPTDTILYSLDNGISFQSRNISADVSNIPQKIRIQSIISDPVGASGHFILLGDLVKSKTTVSLMLDFTKSWTRQCQFDNQDDSKSDFENWSLNNKTSCFFGANVEYLRRKDGHECYIGSCYRNFSSFIPCECTISDFECDPYRTLSGSKDSCIQIPGTSIPEPSCVNGFKQPLSGYIKKQISGCIDGFSHQLEPIPCGRGFSISWFSILFVIPTTIFVIYVFYLYLNGELGRHGAIYLPITNEGDSKLERFMAVAGVAANQIGNFIYSTGMWCIEWIQGKIRGSSGYSPVPNHYYDPDQPTNQSLSLDWDDE